MELVRESAGVERHVEIRRSVERKNIEHFRRQVLNGQLGELPQEFRRCRFLPVKEKYSCDVAVIPQQPAKAFTTTHSAPGLLLPYFVVREQQQVTLSLVVSLALIMIDEIGQRPS